MAVWVVRGGKHGEREEEALENGMLTIGWNELGDLSGVQTKEDVKSTISGIKPHFTPNQLGTYTGQIWNFTRTIQTGNLVVMPRKGQPTIAIGKIMGEYQYRPECPGFIHGRPVEWINREVPRDILSQDLKRSFYTVSVVFQPQSIDAEKRFRAIAGSCPVQLDLAEMGTNQVRDFVGKKFKGHEFTRLVAEVLKALGYGVEVAAPGPDGGVYIVAGGGPMAFDPPRICVQVKSGSGSTDVHVLRELAGAIKNFGADYGLLVSWGGFNSAAKREARESSYFNMRLWDAETFLELLFDNYDKLPSVLKAELPLKQIWVLDAYSLKYAQPPPIC